MIADRIIAWALAFALALLFHVSVSRLLQSAFSNPTDSGKKAMRKLLSSLIVMKRLGLIAAFVALLSFAAAAQVGGLSFPGPGPRVSSGAPPTFTGILDIASIPPVVMSFGAHCPRSSYTGNLVDVFDLASGTVKATLNCSSGGVIGVTSGSVWTLAMVRSNCTATEDCFATRLYDTSGALSCTGGTACDMSMTSTTSPNLVTADGSSTCGSGTTFAHAGTFCLQTNTSGIPDPVSGALSAAIPQPIVYLFTYATLSTTDEGDLVYNTGNTVRTLSDQGNATSTFNTFAGSTVVTVTAAEAQWHTAFAQFDGATSCAAIDNGACVTTSPGTGTIASGDTIGFTHNPAADEFFGFFGDIYVFKATITAAQSTVYANEKAFWGGGMP
jgi:hypothetical protein